MRRVALFGLLCVLLVGCEKTIHEATAPLAAPSALAP